MVFRSAVDCLLIAVLMACPYPCLMGAAASMGGPATGSCQAHDSCCPSSGSKTSKDRPSAPVSCPESGTCLCHGAVMDRHVAPPTPDCEIVTFLPMDAVPLVGAVSAIEQGFSTEQAACHFAAADSGRAVRALIASLLL